MKERTSVDLYYPVSTLNSEKYPTHWLAQCGSLWLKKELLTPRNSKQACHLLLALLVIRHTSLFLRILAERCFSIMLNERHDKEDRK
jgi:hypothetical protein